MKKLIGLCALSIAAYSTLACSNNLTTPNNSVPMVGMTVGKNQVMTQNQMIGQTANQYTVENWEPFVAEFMFIHFGCRGTKVRGLKLRIQDLKSRGELFAGMDDTHSEVIFIEHKGEFRNILGYSVPASGGVEAKATTYPYASVVIDANTGYLFSQSLYDERYLPR